MPLIRITPLQEPYVGARDVEIVERKGLGHPDTISDALAEAFSAALCRYYREHFGRVLHHNVDKALLVGGKARPVFGGGEVEEPIEIYIVGRATQEVNGHRVPVEDLYHQTTRSWIRRHFRYLDPDRHMRFYLKVRPGSPDLVQLFLRSDFIPLSNDTSFGVGFYPWTPLERVVYEAEQYLLSPPVRERFPALGEDIKVMGVRYGARFRITVAAAFVSSQVPDAPTYYALKGELQTLLVRHLSEIAGREVEVDLNTADGGEEVYITVTGTSAEGGDDGQVGRGNRANGLITPYRPMSLEAAAGKNPISHVGKLYNILANQIARQVVEGIEEVREAYVYLVSQIGKPITEPQVVDVKIRTEGPISPGVRQEAERITTQALETLPSLWTQVISGEVRVY